MIVRYVYLCGHVHSEAEFHRLRESPQAETTIHTLREPCGGCGDARPFEPAERRNRDWAPGEPASLPR